ncbi:polysaccharide biosynthesis tyrosine autokinase [Aporhodopirellula aestuarii]|uniref:non-specific protein-tyrosine kinase n=1 Tax=Aporhodopirellula aestuarii TaxID=2950107 RepID=A0ABT0UA24_9BACT|nr:polysaccharide biosynthesis tyrosine autokinase [Aporhodopirellula aestuarii]MCM2373842.1 polysaccharide biosynthesis tyrosine autokinase [Aporhodopirellula aestuarii]
MSISSEFQSDHPGTYQSPAGNASGMSAGGPSVDSADLLASVWRYRWAVLIPAVLGAMVGFIVFLKTPETFASATLLMFESDRPVVFDNLTGDVVGGVPPIDILRSQLFSDTVIQDAFQNENFEIFREQFDENESVFAEVSSESLSFETDIQDTQSASSLVAALSFESTNPELCLGAVRSYSAAIQQFFAKKHKSSRTELLRLITVATDQLQPKMSELEQRYRDFRTAAPLVWNERGEAVNPHRERQLYLTERRSELFEQSRQKSIELAAIQSIAKEGKDALVSLSIIGQLVGKTFDIPEVMQTREDMREGDTRLKQLELDEQLVPLIIERNKYAAEFGEQHPTVKQLDVELKMMKSELKRLVTEQAERVFELMEKNKVEGVDPATRAKEAVEVILFASKAEVELLNQQIAELDQQIASEKSEAVKLARYEQENNAMLREIDRNRELIDQLEEQMARVELTEEEGGVRVVELTAPSRAELVGPSILKMLGIGTFLGLAMGCGLALLLEKNANTFRDPDEITEAIGVPILTHIPFFKGRVRKSKPDHPNPFEKLDPYLAVVHQPASVPAEAIRSCRTSIFFDLSNVPGGKIIQVTSPLPGDGKSTVAGNLACSIAQSGKKTLLIDCDLRRPQITDNFDAAEQLGLIDVLNGHCEHIDAIHQTPLATLRLMPSGPIPANPAEALTLTEMGELLELLRDEFDYIIVDTPPLLVVTDPSIMASLVDAVVMTLKIRRKSKPNLKEAAGILRTVGARVVGVVVNNSDESSSSDGYKGYGYYRYGRHTSRYYRKTKESGPKAGQPRTPIVVSGRAVGLRASAAAAKPTSIATSSSTNGTDDV